MNQDEFLERLWVEVINSVEAVALPAALNAPAQDVQHVARMARYEALFDWCYAFDEEGRTVAWWLKKSAEDPRWLGLTGWTQEAAALRRKPRPGTPFADAEEARMRLLDVGVSGEGLAELMTAQGRLALEKLREILASQKWSPRQLSGPHEALLSADPSGLEGRPGSWPVRPAEVEPSPRGPRLTLKKAHALAFSPDGARVVAAKGGAITDIASGQVVAKCELLAHTSHVTWSPDGKWIAAASTSGHIALCVADTGARVAVLPQEGEGVAPCFTSERELVGASWGGALYRWDVEQGQLLKSVRLEVSMIKDLAVTADGHAVVLGFKRETKETACLRLDPEMKACLSVLPLPTWVERLALAGVGRALLSGHKQVAWLDLKTGEVSLQIASRELVMDASVSPDGRWVVLATQAGFRISAAEDLASGRTHPMAYASSVSFSADSRSVALATWNTGEVWDVEALLRAAS